MVIDPTTLSGDKVVFGATVTLLDEDDKKVRYQLVGQVEADANARADQLQFAARPRADRPPEGRRGRGLDAGGRPLLRDQEDRVHLSRAAALAAHRDQHHRRASPRGVVRSRRVLRPVGSRRLTRCGFIPGAAERAAVPCPARPGLADAADRDAWSTGGWSTLASTC